jgi:CheY-like chemotaxis protein
MKPQRILIADDDEKVLALLSSSLQKSGYITSQAIDGATALELAKKERPDLILADITMPKMDGFDLCKQIREDPSTANIPFIFLTAKGELNDRVTGLNLGADDYISKPFHISEVTARIKTILQRVAVMSQAPVEDTETDLKGDLEQWNLGEVLQTLGMAQKNGVLRISNGTKLGKIYFEGGSIFQASLDKYKSEEAVYRIISWEEGYFEFDSKDRAAQKTIDSGTNSLLMEGFNQREEFLKYKKAMPSFDFVVKVTENEQAQEIKPASQKVLELIDGQRTIQDIIDISPISYLITTKILYTFLKKGSIEASERLQEQERIDDYGQLAQELYE